MSNVTDVVPVNMMAKDKVFTLAAAFAAALTVSIAFYWIQIFFFKKRFMDTLQLVIPNHESLLYNTGSIKYLNADELLTFNDLKAEEFYQENGKVRLHWENIFEQQNIPQQMGAVRNINFDHMVHADALDPHVFTMKEGKITIDFPSVIQDYNLIKDPEKSRILDARQLVTSEYLKELYIDLKTGLVHHFSKLGALTQDMGQNGIMLKEQILVVGEGWEKVFFELKKSKTAQILPLTPWTIKLLDQSGIDVSLRFADSVIVENIEKVLVN